MPSLPPPPLNHPIAERDGKTSTPWARWLRNVFDAETSGVSSSAALEARIVAMEAIDHLALTIDTPANGLSLGGVGGQILSMALAAAGVAGVISTGAQVLGQGTKTVDALVSTGALTVDTSTLLVDAVNHIVKLGSFPGYTTSATNATQNAMGRANVVNNDGVNFLSAVVDCYSGGASNPVGNTLTFRGARGTQASPLPVQTDDYLGDISGRGWHTGGAFPASAPVGVFMRAGSQHTASSLETYVEVVTTPAGSIARARQLLVHGTGVSVPGSFAVDTDVFGVSATSDYAFVGPSPGYTALGAHAGTTNGAAKLHIVNNDVANYQHIWLDAYSGGAGTAPSATGITMRASRGTLSSRSAVSTDDEIGFLGARAWHSGGAFTTTNKALIFFRAAEAWTSSAQGTYVTVDVTAAGGTVRAERLRVHGTGATVTGTLNATTALQQNGAAVATLTGVETLTNKTLTSPTINSGAISGTFSGGATFSGALILSNTLTTQALVAMTRNQTGVVIGEIKNSHTGGYSSFLFQDAAAGANKLGIGWGNSGTVAPFTSSAFLELFAGVTFKVITGTTLLGSITTAGILDFLTVRQNGVGVLDQTNTVTGITNKSFTPEGWTNATLLNSWVTFGGNYATAGYRKLPDGCVQLRGAVKNGSSGTAVIMTLPVGYRPTEQIVVPTSSNGRCVFLIVTTAGNVSTAASVTEVPDTTEVVLNMAHFPTT